MKDLRRRFRRGRVAKGKSEKVKEGKSGKVKEGNVER